MNRLELELLPRDLGRSTSGHRQSAEGALGNRIVGYGRPSVTALTARVMKRDNEYGRIAPGYVSDLIIVDGDPTINISDIRKVRMVLRGDPLYDSGSLWKSMGIAPAP